MHNHSLTPFISFPSSVNLPKVLKQSNTNRLTIFCNKKSSLTRDAALGCTFLRCRHARAGWFWDAERPGTGHFHLQAMWCRRGRGCGLRVKAATVTQAGFGAGGRAGRADVRYHTSWQKRNNRRHVKKIL